MKCTILFLFLIFGGTWRIGHPTCVLESDFGFILNCAFKKSGLFRVRNLGGVKAHVGLGFSLGDELGFKESLSNVDSNRRRSVQGSPNLQALLAQNPKMVTNPQQSLQIHSSSTVIPPFRPIPPAPERPLNPTLLQINNTRKITADTIVVPALKGKFPGFSNLGTSNQIISLNGNKNGAVAVVLPTAVKRVSAQENKLSSTNLSTRTLPTVINQVPDNGIQKYPNPIQILSAATNISADALEAALLKHQLLKKQQELSANTVAPYIPPSTTNVPVRHAPSSYNKVMNAPREYYPVGYDKNYDDNFVSRVDLPETSFYCGDQKHFPGLYADEDLGCMVFHVCALTDDGLIMKSFLCPESTLFDQSILKCNWWFYVECKNSKKLYDSNIPVSKSYQLMKALTFFSSYKNEAPAQKSN